MSDDPISKKLTGLSNQVHGLEKSFVARLDRTDAEHTEDIRRLRDEMRREASEIRKTAERTEHLIMLLVRLHVDGTNGTATDELKAILAEDTARQSATG